MGNYIFDTGVLVDELSRDASSPGESAHDFGRNILPEMVARGADVYAYDFSQNEIPGAHETERGYWRDVGTIGAYWQANMDLVQVVPTFDLYNERWPIRSWTRPLPPAKFVFADPGDATGQARMGIATDSLVSEGCIISGGRIDRTVCSPQVRINSFAHVEESVLLDGVDVGRHARIRRAIVDKDVHVPSGVEIGYDPETDARRFTVSDGIVVVPKGYRFE
jgi:glucose-1-phosphate adenylyltransferase